MANPYSGPFRVKIVNKGGMQVEEIDIGKTCEMHRNTVKTVPERLVREKINTNLRAVYPVFREDPPTRNIFKDAE